MLNKDIMTYVEYVLLECDGLNCMPNVIYKTRFSEDVKLMKRMYELNNRHNRYKIEEYRVIKKSVI